MIGVFTRNGLVRSDDNVIAFKLFRRQTTAVVTVVHDRLERSRRAVILDLLLPACPRMEEESFLAARV